MTKNRTSMADIAAHAGVSTATVSRVFNGVGQVSDETRRKVLTAIDELGYDRPTPERTPDTPTIGIIVPELTNPIFAAFAHHLQEEVARAGGIAMIRSQTPGATSEFDHLSSLLEHRVSGLIFVSGRHADIIEETFYTYEAAAAHTNGLIERGVTAIVTGSDLQALGAIRTITSLGLSVPEDISVIGFDDSFLMSHLSPGLTTVHQPVPAIVAAAVRSLFEALATPDYTPEHADYVFSADLVVRATTARAK